jgi:ATP-dependent Clp protease adaptor protein ClpS
MTQESTATVTKEKIADKINEPGLYKVVFFNDDLTPMDFVVQVLMTIFKHSESTANKITQEVHSKGEGIAGIFTYEIAEQKGVETTVLAREQGFPLAIKVEPE